MSAVDLTIEHDCHQLVCLFDSTFLYSEATRLVAGAEEPYYQPAQASGDHNQILFTRDYFASALHEVAHWCVAGQARRQLPDYGYWYAPDGRSSQQQQAFERAEVRPQALEWLFSVATGYRFRVSADNLAMGLGASDSFKDAIHARVLWHCREGVSSRVAAFLTVLIQHYGSAANLADLLQPERFPRESL